ncbi:MAG: hypothetical protein U0V73_02960 [Acidimicrobiia bacterium]
MTAEGRFGWTLLVSVALWYPSLRQAMSNNLAAADALMRFGLSLIVAYMLVGFFDWLLDNYLRTNATRVLEERRREAVASAEARTAARKAEVEAAAAE